MSSSSSDEEELVLLLAVSLATNRKRKWVHEINEKRKECGKFHRLCSELSSFEDRFFTYFRMSQELFDSLNTLLEPKISKLNTNWRKPIPTKERLAICVRYLATGDSHHTIAFSFRVGRSTVSSIIKEVCMEIWNVLQPLYLPNPTEEVWMKSEVGFRERWNFPNCIGSIDGKHVRIKCPNNSGSNYFCYKNYFSIVLLAVVDPYYNFTVVDIGSYGRHSDSAIFQNSSFYRDFVDKETIGLPPKPLPGTDTPVPHVFVGDEGFKLETYLMRPFPRSTVVDNIQKLTYNKRLCRARRVVENAFGILAQKWRILFRPIEGDVDTTVHIVKAACCLHNYIRAHQNTTESEEQVKCVTNQVTNVFSTTARSRERSSTAAQAVRNHFVRYFYDVDH